VSEAPNNKDWWDSVSLLRTLMPPPHGELVEVTLSGDLPEDTIADVARVTESKIVIRFDRKAIEADSDTAMFILAHQWALMFTLDHEPSYCPDFGHAYSLCWTIISGLDAQ
jgi:hypothetical protein